MCHYSLIKQLTIIINQIFALFSKSILIWSTLLFINVKKMQAFDYIFTKVLIDNIEYNFMIDNGFQITTFFTTRIRKSNLNSHPTKMITPDYSAYPFRITNEKISIELVEHHLIYRLHVGLIDTIPSIMQTLNIDGIIGADILSRHDWRINFEDKKISLVKRSKLKRKMFNVVDFEENWRIPLTLQLSNEYRLNVLAELDMGCYCYFNIWDSLSVASDSIRKIQMVYFVSPEPTEKVSKVHVSKVIFDNFEINNMPVFFDPRRSSNLIGIQFLALFGEVYLLNSKRKVYFAKKNHILIKIPRVNIHDGVVKSYLSIKGMSEPQWYIGQKVDEKFELTSEDYLYFNISIEGKTP